MKSAHWFVFRLVFVAAALAVSLGFGAAVAADATGYPNRPVRLVVGFPPGGGLDTVARIMAPRLQAALGRPWVVDNRIGAAGNIATEIVVSAPADGYTVLIVQGTSLTVSPTLYKLSFDVERDLKPVVLIATTNYVLVTHPSTNAGTIKELIELAKARPGKLNYGSAGIGSPHHLSAELFKMRAGIDIAHVPYKGGGPATVAVLGNEVQILFGSLSSLLPHIKGGRVRALGVTGANRSAAAPDIPTIAESGFPGFDVTSWFGMLVPARTPDAVVKTIHSTTAGILEIAEVRAAIQREGLDVTPAAPKEFSQRIRKETQVFANLIRKANIRAD